MAAGRSAIRLLEGRSAARVRSLDELQPGCARDPRGKPGRCTICRRRRAVVLHTQRVRRRHLADALRPEMTKAGLKGPPYIGGRPPYLPYRALPAPFGSVHVRGLAEEDFRRLH